MRIWFLRRPADGQGSDARLPSTMLTVEPGDQVVARLWRWDEERLREDALADHRMQLRSGRLHPDYSVSVFAGPPLADGGDVDEACEQVTELATDVRSARWITFTTRSRLERAGFKIRLSEPPPGHHDVVLGDDLAAADVAGLAEVFSEQERRRLP